MEINKYSRFLAELRKRLIFTLIVFSVATVVGFVFYEPIIKFLIGVLKLEGINIVFTSPFQFINLAISCGVAVGMLVTLPLLMAQIWSFLRPALKKTESKLLTRFLPVSIGLFMTGFLFGMFLMRWQIGIFLAKSVELGIGNILDISKLLSTVLLTSVLMGAAFEFPLVMLLLMRLGLVERGAIAKRRLWVYLGAFLFTMLLPADSIVTDVLLSLPLIALFELTLLFGRQRGLDITHNT